MKYSKRSKKFTKHKRSKKHTSNKHFLYIIPLGILAGIVINMAIDNEKKINYKSLNEYLSTNRIVQKNVKGDGNCLFNSLSMFLKKENIEITPRELRTKIVNYVEKDNEGLSVSFSNYDDDTNNEFSKKTWCEKMIKDAEYGDGYCIKAFNELYDYTVEVFMKEKNIIVLTHESISKKLGICHLIYEQFGDGGHYDIAY